MINCFQCLLSVSTCAATVWEDSKFLLRTQTFSRESSITDAEDVSYVVSPYLPRALRRVGGRGLHSFTSQLNLSTFYRQGGALRSCVDRVKGVFRVCREFSYVTHGSSSAEKWTSVSP